MSDSSWRNAAGSARATVFTNAVIRTMTAPGDIAEAVAVRGERIVAVGSREDVLAAAGSGAEVQDLGGGLLTPGLIDPHTHLEVLERYDDSLDGLASQHEVLAGLVAKAMELVPDEWLILSVVVADSARPTPAQLNAALPDRPVVIMLGGGRYLINEPVLQQLDPDLVVREGAFVETDDLGKPTGYIATKGEDRLKYVVRNAPLYTRERVDKAVRTGMERLLRAGITSAGHVVKDPWPIEAYRRLLAEGRLPLRMGLLTRIWQGEFGIDDIPALGLDTEPAGRLRLHALKISIDGYFPHGGARFTEPYADAPGDFGFFRIPLDTLNEIVGKAHRAGFRVALHANGDAAIDAALDAYEQALRPFPRADHRHRIEHFGNQYYSGEQLARARSLGLVAVPNPTFLQGPARYLAERLGPKRSAQPVPLRSLIDAGLGVGVASDYAGLSPLEPLASISALVTRKTASGEIFSPHEAISAWEALELYTARNAWVNFEEGEKGQITPGRLADFTHFSHDIVGVPAEEIAAATVRGTVVGGQWAYRGQD